LSKVTRNYNNVRASWGSSEAGQFRLFIHQGTHFSLCLKSEDGNSCNKHPICGQDDRCWPQGAGETAHQLTKGE